MIFLTNIPKLIRKYLRIQSNYMHCFRTWKWFIWNVIKFNLPLHLNLYLLVEGNLPYVERWVYFRRVSCLQSDSKSHYSNSDLLSSPPELIPLHPHTSDNLCPIGLNCWLPIELRIQPELLSFFIEWYIFYYDLEVAKCIIKCFKCKKASPHNLSIL